MGGLRYVNAPRKRGPSKALLAVGLVTLLAAAFGVGRLGTRPAAPKTVAAAVPTVPPPAPPTAVPAVAATAPPRAAPTVPFQPPVRLSEAFEVARAPAPAAPPPPPAEPPAPRTEKETLAKQIARWLTLPVS